MINVLVFFHGDNDGFAAASIAQKFLDSRSGWRTEDVLYIPVQYDQPFPMELVNQDVQVYVLDFSWPRVVMDEVATKAKKLVVLDHHKTAQVELAGAPYATFDMTKSGNVLAWEFFYPNKPVPEFDLLVQDRDLWTKLYGDRTESLSSFIWGVIQLATTPAKVSDLLYRLHDIRSSQTYLEKVISLGMPRLEVRATQLEKYKADEYWFVVQTEYGIAKVANVIENISNAAEVMYTDQSTESDFTMTYEVKSTTVKFSLRSPTIDVSVIAKALGGGGHEAAAGFIVPLAEGLAFIINLSNTRIVKEAA